MCSPIASSRDLWCLGEIKLLKPSLSCMASQLATLPCRSKSAVLEDVYGRSNAIAILTRCIVNYFFTPVLCIHFNYIHHKIFLNAIIIINIRGLPFLVKYAASKRSEALKNGRSRGLGPSDCLDFASFVRELL